MTDGDYYNKDPCTCSESRVIKFVVFVSNVVTKVLKVRVQQRSERVVNEFITVRWCSVVHCLHYGGWTFITQTAEHSSCDSNGPAAAEVSPDKINFCIM